MNRASIERIIQREASRPRGLLWLLAAYALAPWMADKIG